MFESGYKLADAWSGLWMDASKGGTTSIPKGMARRLGNNVGGEIYQRGANVMHNPRKRMIYGGGVVGVSSGAYMWHRHNMNKDYSDPNSPYYY